VTWLPRRPWSVARAEIDAAYAAYDTHPIDEPDEWGDLASFRDAATPDPLPCGSAGLEPGAGGR
jgi:hypothetical protein